MRQIKSLLFLFIMTGLLSSVEAQDSLGLKKQIFTLYCYDAGDAIISESYGFFYDARGSCLARYQPFIGAESCVIEMLDGKKYTVDRLDSYNEELDLVSFSVKQEKGRNNPFTLSFRSPLDGDHAYLPAYDTQGILVLQTTMISAFKYFDFDYPIILSTRKADPKCMGMPVFNGKGEVIAVNTSLAHHEKRYNILLSIKNLERLEPYNSATFPIAVPIPNENIPIHENKSKPDKKEYNSYKVYGDLYDSLQHYEKRLKMLGDSMVDGSHEFVRMDAVTDFIPLFVKTLGFAGSYNYPFDSLFFMKILQAPDKSFRLYNWALKFDNHSYRYYGALQLQGDDLQLIPVYDYSEKIAAVKDLEYMELENDRWFGALYYDIGMMKNKNAKYYILLGWDGDDLLSDKKLIEILWFDDEGCLKFGAPVIEEGRDMKYRKIFQYNPDAIMVLRFEKELELISFDHLVPPDAKSRGKFWTYIPDGTYDFFEIKKGKLIFGENLFEKYQLPPREGEIYE
jgi:hypothetical protein